VTDMPTLQSLIAGAMREKEWSDRRVAGESTGLVSHETVRKIRVGLHSGNLDEDTVNGLSLALNIPRSQILGAIGRTVVAELGSWNPPSVANRMTRRQRRAVEQLITAMVVPGDEQSETVTPIRQRAARPKSTEELGRVARKRDPKARPLDEDENWES
jgi:hypothetical protein